MAIVSKPLDEVRENVPVHLVNRQDLVRVNIVVPANVRKDWKSAALRIDKTVTEMIFEAMNDYVARIPKNS